MSLYSLGKGILDKAVSIPDRLEGDELLDLGVGTQEEVARNLREMHQFNHWFGGTHALTRHLVPLITKQNRPVTVVDLGTGMAGLPAHLVNQSKFQNIIFAVDTSFRCLAVARQHTFSQPRIQLVQADVLSLPFTENQVDFVISTLFMHHFTPGQLIHVLKQSYALARLAVVMSDLVRGRLPLAAFRVLQPVFARSYLTRKDGALSIRRAYLPDELCEIAAEAGLSNPRVFSHWPWRMTLVAEK